MLERRRTDMRKMLLKVGEEDVAERRRTDMRKMLLKGGEEVAGKEERRREESDVDE